MGKRSDFERIEDDFYPTPYEAVLPLLPFLHPGTVFAEPCAGDMSLVEHLCKNGHTCTWASDKIDRSDRLCDVIDALSLTDQIKRQDYIITNPPWDRSILHKMIKHFVEYNTAWLLFDADWMHTKQATEYIDKYCTKIVSVGRVKWIADSDSTGMDNACWYQFLKKPPHLYGPALFCPRKEHGSLV